LEKCGYTDGYYADRKSAMYMDVLKNPYSGKKGKIVGRTLSRAEFAALTARIVGVDDWFAANISTVEDLEKVSEEIKSVFSDVVGFQGRRHHWASVYLIFAYNQGIITGDGDGNFRPNDCITEREAVAMVVRALGYGEMAQELCGFPYGYIQIANELGVLEHTQMNLAVERVDLLIGNLLLLLFNALEVEVTF